MSKNNKDIENYLSKNLTGYKKRTGYKYTTTCMHTLDAKSVKILNQFLDNLHKKHLSDKIDRKLFIEDTSLAIGFEINLRSLDKQRSHSKNTIAAVDSSIIAISSALNSLNNANLVHDNHIESIANSIISEQQIDNLEPLNIEALIKQLSLLKLSYEYWRENKPAYSNNQHSTDLLIRDLGLIFKKIGYEVTPSQGTKFNDFVRICLNMIDDETPIDNPSKKISKAIARFPELKK